MALAGSVAVFASALVKVPGAAARAAALAHRPQARLARHHARPVRGRPRQPVLGDRRRPRRRRDARGRRRLGRGLLADGLRADQPGARPLQRPRRAAGDGLARVGGRREDPGDRGRRHLPDAPDRRPAGRGRRCPGQYVTVQVPMPDGVRQPRQYSLTRADDGEHRQFSVKRVRGGGKPDGEVSNLLCDSVGVGDRLTMSLPFGDVVLDDSAGRWCSPAPGIGITPMAGMLSHLARRRLAPADHAAARRRRRGLLRPARAGARRRPRSCPAPRRTSGTSGAPRAPLPVDGAHRADGPRRREAARRRRVLPLRPAAVHAGASAAR